jgi:DNA mismatch repair protein MutS
MPPPLEQPQLSLFAAPSASATDKLLDQLDPDALTPRQALDWVYTLKQAHDKNKKR